MNELEEMTNSPSFRCYVEMGEQLSQLKCDNEVCVENALPASGMYILQHTAQGRINFKIMQENVCCPSFGIVLKKKADEVHLKYKPQ